MVKYTMHFVDAVSASVCNKVKRCSVKLLSRQLSKGARVLKIFMLFPVLFDRFTWFQSPFV